VLYKIREPFTILPFYKSFIAKQCIDSARKKCTINNNIHTYTVSTSSHMYRTPRKHNCLNAGYTESAGDFTTQSEVDKFITNI